MKSLLEALKEGRLVELPDSNKEDALELLAHLIDSETPHVYEGYPAGKGFRCTFDQFRRGTPEYEKPCR